MHVLVLTNWQSMNPYNFVTSLFNQYINQQMHVIKCNSWPVWNSHMFRLGVPSSGSFLEHMKTNPTLWSRYCFALVGVIKILSLTYSMEQSPTWEANRLPASQEIPRILWNPKVHYRIQNARHLPLSWANSIQFIPSHPSSWRFILILSVHLLLDLLSKKYEVYNT